MKLELAYYYGTSFFDRCVAWWDNDPTHVAIKYGEEKIEAKPFKGVRKVHWRLYSPYSKVVVCKLKHITDEQSKIVWSWLEEQVGKGYDYLGIFGFVISDPKIENPKRWFCSELSEAAFQRAGIILTPTSEYPSEVSPSMQFSFRNSWSEEIYTVTT